MLRIVLTTPIDLNTIVKPPKKPNNSAPDDMNNKPSKILKMDKKNIEELLRSVMQEHLNYQTSAKIENTKNMHKLINLISEYLSPFLILGYDVTGKPVNIIHAKSQMDADALGASINRFFFNAVKKDSDE